MVKTGNEQLTQDLLSDNSIQSIEGWIKCVRKKLCDVVYYCEWKSGSNSSVHERLTTLKWFDYVLGFRTL